MAPAPRPAPGPRRRVDPADGVILLLFLALTALFFWRPVFVGQPLSAADIIYQSPPWLQVRDSAPILGGGRLWNSLMSDNVYGYYPEEVTATRFLGQGILPLWDPYVFSGTPLLAESQRGVFYPPNLLLRLLPGAWTFSYGVILHFVLAGWFMFALLRSLGLPRGPAAIGGIVFEFSGWMVAWVLTPYGIYTVVWLPSMILCYERAIRQRSLRWTVATGLTIALQLLAGQIQFVSYNLLALGLWGGVRVLVAARTLSPESRAADRDAAAGQEAPRLPAARHVSPVTPIVAGSLALAVGLTVGAVQLAPTLEILGLSGRGVRVLEDMLAHDLMPLPHLFTSLVPYFFGSFLGGESYSGWLNMLETTFYVGLASLCLALIALTRGRRPAVFAFALIGLLPLLVLLFPAVFSLFYFAVPGFKQTFPSRLLYLTTFGFAALAAFGAVELLAAGQGRRRWVGRLSPALLVVWGVAAVVVLVWPYVAEVRPAALARFDQLTELPFSLDQIAHLRIALGLLGLFIAAVILIGRRLVPARYGSALLAGIIVIDLFSFGIDYNPAFPAEALYPVTPAIAFLQERPDKGRLAAGDGVILPPNIGAVYGLEDVRGYTSLYSRRYQEVIAATQGDLPVYPLMEDGRANRNQLLSIGRTDSPLFRALNPRYLIEHGSDLPARSIRNWADAVTVDSDVKDVLRPRFYEQNDRFDRVLNGHPPASITYHLPDLPDRAELQIGFGTDSQTWDEAGDGVTFEVFGRRPGAAPILLFSRYVDPKSNPEDRIWFEERIDLAAFAGGPVEVTLRTLTGPADDDWFDWALWADPQIVFGRPILPDLAATPSLAEPLRLTIDGVTHTSLRLAGGEAVRATLPLPEHGRLSLAVAALMPDLDWATSPADLTVTIDGAPVLERRFDPSRRADQHHWSQIS
ncbi:MAG TPA: hypothetical protein VHL09_16335, partial [Dehalococcoidia bacterium]|nr:hypothetical protein [Dehalococcoidia bacterium]